MKTKILLFFLLIAVPFAAMSQVKGDVLFKNKKITTKSVDGSQNNDTGFVDTTPPVVTSVTVSNITATSFTVTWSLNEGSTGQIEYGIDTNYEDVTVKENNYLDFHIQTVSGLTPNTAYFFRILGEDFSGNSFVGTQRSVTTLPSNPADTTAPVITSGPTTVNRGSTSFSVNWALNEGGTGQIEYGLTTGYGNTTTLESSFLTTHAQTVVGLLPNTSYNYRVIGQDAAANAYVSPNVVVTTTNAPVDTFVDCTGGASGSYTPTSWADVIDVANVNKTAIITNSFAFTSGTPATGQAFQANGGVISGTSIDLGDVCIEDNYQQIFASNATFSTNYVASRISPETFGAAGDGVTNDRDILQNLVDNCSYMKGDATSAYVVNSPINSTDTAVFNFDGNGCTITNTESTGFNFANIQQEDYWFYLENKTPIVITNTIFDGKDDVACGLNIYHCGNFTFENNVIRNLYNPNNDIAYALRHRFFAVTDNVTEINIKNNLFEEIRVAYGGTVNQAGQGISKAIYQSMYDDSATGNCYYEGNTIRGIYGDDAEGVYIIPGFFSYSASDRSSMTHNFNFFFKNENYTNCERRNMKINESNLDIRDSYFGSTGRDQEFNGQNAVLVGIFGVFANASNNLKNVTLINNTFEELKTGGHTFSLVSFTDVENVLVQNNTFTRPNFGLSAGLNLGTGTSGYTGIIKDTQINSNTFLNAGLVFSNIFSGDNVNFQNNSLTADDATGANPGNAVSFIHFRDYQAGSIMPGNGALLKTNTYTVDNMPSFFRGVFTSYGGTPKNLKFEDSSITYLQNGLTYPFGMITTAASRLANFDSSNSITNFNIIGDIGTAAIYVTGSNKSVVITNSFGDGNTPITTN